MSLTLKQRKWVDSYLATGNATKSALEVYDCTYDTARNIGSQNLAKRYIRDYINNRYEEYALVAFQNIRNLSEQATNEHIRLRANQSIVDRVWGKSLPESGSIEKVGLSDVLNYCERTNDFRPLEHLQGKDIFEEV
jgi:hypothetical protein